MHKFDLAFNIDSTIRVLDVGGSTFNWNFLTTKPRIVLSNISYPKHSDRGNEWVIADGRWLPFKDHAFDIVYSNSVIEHLENLENQRRFASECIRVGMRYFIQTPNKRFFVEPHLITPFIHWLPLSLQKRLIRNFTIWGLVTRPDTQRIETFLNEIRMLDKQEFQALFPDAYIWQERVLGFTKSLIAVKH